MKVWIDIFSGDEMVSDSYKMTLCMNDACLEVAAKYETKGNDNIAIASDDVVDDDGEGVTVINIVEAHKLEECTLTQKDFMAIIKPYMKRVVAHLKENGKEDRVDGFKKGATEMIKFIVSKFDEMQIFTGAGFDTEAGLAFSYTKDGESEPTFMFFNDGYKEEKY